MDGIVGQLDFGAQLEEQTVPSTPKDAEPVAMAGIAALLSSALAPLSSAMNEMKADVANLRVEVEEIESMNQVRHDNIQTDVESLRAEISTVKGKHQTLELKIGKLEEIIEELTNKGTVPMTRTTTDAEVADNEQTAVLGGLSSFPGEAEAFQWLEAKLWDLYGPGPTKMYTKGDFKGMIFAKFKSKEDRDTAVDLIRSMARSYDDPEVWAKPDMLLAPRTIRSIVFGTKHAMTERGWPKQALWADPTTGTLKLAGEIVLTVGIKGNKVQTEYGEGWDNYFNDHRYPQVKELVKAACDKMQKGSGKGTGKDKGSKGSTLGY